MRGTDPPMTVFKQHLVEVWPYTLKQVKGRGIMQVRSGICKTAPVYQVKMFINSHTASQEVQTNLLEVENFYWT